jgi:MarR family 2-MHQ and catechol resistance regulon transcriptional repressor
MPTRQSPPRQLSLAAQVTDTADQPFVDVARALIQAGFLFVNETERPYQSYDLTLAQMDVLSALARTDGDSISCSEIAERTLITKGGITGILDRLEARGLVKRFPSSDDRRSVLVRLSAKGVELFRKLYPELARANRSILERAFKRQQMKEFGELLEVLIRSIERPRS